jgi:hypothetical protein
MISGRVVGKEIDENGNIRVATEYTLTDGTKQTGHTRYNCFGFSADAVAKDVKAHCETLMKKVYALKTNQTLIATDLSKVTYECTSVEIVTKPAVMDKDGVVVTPAEKITIDDK